MREIMGVVLVLCTFNCAGSNIDLEHFQNLYCMNSRKDRYVNMKEELNRRNIQSSLNNNKPSFSFSVMPSYSESISPVMQPDGTFKNYNIHNFNMTPSFSASFPIDISGGTLSIASSVGFYRNINKDNSFSNISANLYSVRFSQPLSFFKSSKWAKKNAIANYNIASISIIKDHIGMKNDATKLFFNILSNNLMMENIENEILMSDSVKIILMNLKNAGKIMETEIEALELEIMSKRILLQELQIKQESLINETISNMNESVTIGLFKNLEIPKFPDMILDIENLMDILLEKQSYISAQKGIDFEYLIDEAKKNRSLLPTLQIGVGQNGAGNNFNEIWDNKKLSYDISFNITIPISNLQDNDNKLEIAKLNYNMFKLEQEEYEFQERLKLKEAVNLFMIYKSKMNIKNDLKSLYEKEKIQYINLLRQGKIMYEDYRRTIIKQNENEKEILAIVEEAYLILNQIEILLLFDFSGNESYIVLN